MRVIKSYSTCYTKPLSLKEGDQIQLFEKDVPEKWKGWQWCRDSVNNECWISESYFKRFNEQSDKAKIIKDYTAKEMSVIKALHQNLWVKKAFFSFSMVDINRISQPFVYFVQFVE